MGPGASSVGCTGRCGRPAGRRLERTLLVGEVLRLPAQRDSVVVVHIGQCERRRSGADRGSLALPVVVLNVYTKPGWSVTVKVPPDGVTSALCTK
jgi:hypothetical protein